MSQSFEQLRPARHRGFTIIELIVSVAIVVLLIFAVGVVFRSASRSVGVSQAVMELLSNTGAIQQQMEADVSGINRNGFLVIRSGTFTDNTNPAAVITRRCDQITFLSNGQFQHRGGSSTGSSPFTDVTTAPSALVWWGQLALSQGGGAAAAPLNPRVLLNADQTYHVPLNQVPTAPPKVGDTGDFDYTLGRSAILLVPRTASTNNQSPNGTSISTFLNNTAVTPNLAAIDYGVAQVAANSGEGVADITQSRIDAAATFPAQIMDLLQQAVTGRDAITCRYEADHYCFRRAALRSPYDTELLTAGVPSFVNGYFRMQTIALQGVPTFAVEWTDGGVYGAGDIDPVTNTTLTSTSTLLATTRWFGMNHARSNNNVAGVVDPSGTIASVPNGDQYTAIFSFDNRSLWPVALRFRYHVADPAGRLPSGRDVVQVIKLPSQ